MRIASCVLWLTAAAALAAPAVERPPRLVVNGRVVQTDVRPRIIDGTTLVPLRFVAEALGAEVSWDPRGREAVIVHEGERIAVVAGEGTLVAGSRIIQLRTPAQVIQGRTMVPLRAIAEGLGAQVRWDPATRTVSIRTPTDERAEPSPPEVLRQSVDVELRTAQDTYPHGAPVEMVLRIQNTGDAPVRLLMPTGQQYDFVVRRDGQEVWRWSQGRVFTQAVTFLTLAPDETQTFTVVWNQRDNRGNAVAPGRYTITGLVTHRGDVPLQDEREIRIAGE